LAEAGAQADTIVVTDGVFSMDGTLAPLDRIAPVAAAHGALLVVDDSHATGFVGEHGRGTGEYFGVKPDAVTSTLGKALGGACGGFIGGKKVLVDWLRNSSRPYLFSNSLAPSLAAERWRRSTLSNPAGAQLRARLGENTRRFPNAMRQSGFEVRDGCTPSCR
jgi:glycine C-acetyltransferase